MHQGWVLNFEVFWLKIKYVKTDGKDLVYKEDLSRREGKRKKR